MKPRRFDALLVTIIKENGTFYEFSNGDHRCRQPILTAFIPLEDHVEKFEHLSSVIQNSILPLIPDNGVLKKFDEAFGTHYFRKVGNELVEIKDD